LRFDHITNLLRAVKTLSGTNHCTKQPVKVNTDPTKYRLTTHDSLNNDKCPK